jgi:hypothetical protein
MFALAEQNRLIRMPDPAPPPPQAKSEVRRAISGVVGGALILIGMALTLTIGMFLGADVALVFSSPFLILGALIAGGAFISHRSRFKNRRRSE